MNPSDSRAKLANFLESLPDKVFSFLLDKKLEIDILPIDIAEGYGLTLGEVGNVCEGVKRVLAGEDSAANLVAFIQKDQNIEEDNREKIPQIAYEIQTKIFDVVFPIFKEAGLPLKEGRVPQPSSTQYAVRIKGQTGGGTGEAAGLGLLSPYAPVPSPIGPSPIRPIGPIRPISPDSKSGLPPHPSMLGTGHALGKGALKTAAPLEEKNVRALTRIAAGTTYTEDALRAAFEDLPQGLRQAIASVDTANAIQDIAKQYLLHVDQMAALAGETGLVLLGLTHPAAFIGNLAKRLRLPEERAKEIAREISGKILVKVRDVLRTLHESSGNPKSQAPNTKQIPAPNVQNWTNQATEPLKKLNVMPRKENSPGKLAANRYPSTGGLNASLNTPFSPQAKWSMGTNRQPIKEENILARQAAEKEEALDREEVLKGIENPRDIAQPTTSNQQPTTPVTSPLNAQRLPAAGYPPPGGLNASPVGPTGWRPAAEESGKSQITNSKSQTNPNGQIPNVLKQPTPSEWPVASTPQKQSPEKVRPQSEGALPREMPAQEPQNFLDEKLAGPSGLPREEKDYTTDPYREPLQ